MDIEEIEQRTSAVKTEPPTPHPPPILFCCRASMFYFFYVHYDSHILGWLFHWLTCSRYIHFQTCMWKTTIFRNVEFEEK